MHKQYKKHLKPLCQGKGRIHSLPLCPSKDDVVRRYEVVAVQKKLIYNRYGDHDPNGLVFVPLEDVDNVFAGKCMPKPLILRANAGDWIEVTLHNAWDVESGMWGIFRVVKQTFGHKCKAIYRKIRECF